jgi:proteasome lid subunit RPN8/RPN11
VSTDITITGVTPSVSISDHVLEAIRRHGAEAYPHECCGALLESGGVTGAAFALTNTTDGPAARRFLVGPDQYRHAEKWARERGGNLAGFYHSHPDHPARPSQTDLEHAWPNFVYLIVSVAEGTPRETTCWRLREDRSGFDQGDLRSWRTES